MPSYDRDLNDVSQVPDLWLTHRTLFPIWDLVISDFPLSVPGLNTSGVTGWGTMGRLSHFSLGMELEHQGLTADTAEVLIWTNPSNISCLPVTASTGWWHFKVGGHSAFTSFLLRSYPAFSVTQQMGYSIPTCSQSNWEPAGWEQAKRKVQKDERAWDDPFNNQLLVQSGRRKDKHQTGLPVSVQNRKTLIVSRDKGFGNVHTLLRRQSVPWGEGGTARSTSNQTG